MWFFYRIFIGYPMFEQISFFWVKALCFVITSSYSLCEWFQLFVLSACLCMSVISTWVETILYFWTSSYSNGYSCISDFIRFICTVLFLEVLRALLGKLVLLVLAPFSFALASLINSWNGLVILTFLFGFIWSFICFLS